MKLKQMFKRVVAGVLTAATMLTSFSLPTFALDDDDYNGTGGGKTIVTEGDIPGVYLSYWGYRYAIVDAKTGKVQQNKYDEYLVKDQMQDGTLDDKINSDSTHKDNFVRTDPNTNLGTVFRMYGLFEGQPAPIEENKDGYWVGKGAKFKEWILNPEGYTLGTGEKISWAERIIYTFFGEQVRDDVFAGKYKLVVEPIYYIPLYTDFLSYKVPSVDGSDNFYSHINEAGKREYSSYSGKHYYGTFAGSLKTLYNLPQIMKRETAIGGGGGFQSLAVRASAKCMYLDEDDYNPYC